MQRLFSTFADGWPGVGLLLQRLLIGAALFYRGITSGKADDLASVVVSLVGAASGVLFLLGLWTPVAGTLAAVVQVWMIFSHPRDPWTSVVLATLATTVAMIGPGCWSIDARLFGRKHMEIPRR
jgi:putative oxidoreductase